MKSDKLKPRRQFLKNTSLAALSLGMLPSALQAKSKIAPTELSPEELMMCDKTTLDFYGEGPFYTENPPTMIDNQLAAGNEPGDKLIISGRVYNLDCSEFIPDTIIDVWHANDAGEYDNSGFNLRGKTTTNSQGFFVFETIMPGKYLNGGSFRPSHIHFKITPPGFDVLTTQLYFEGDTDIPDDAAASITSGNFDAQHRIIPLVENGEGVLEGTWDIVIDGDGTTDVNAIHIDKGMIYELFPNPSSEQVLIKYGVFKSAKVSLDVFDANGRLVANLAESNLSPDKYEALWKPDAGLPKGHYFIALKINDLQVHYLKMLRV